MKRLIFAIILFTVAGTAFSDSEPPKKQFFLVEKSRQSSTLPIVFNILPGFGIGSYLQGDIQSGNIMLVGDTLAAAMIAGGGLSYYSSHNESIIEPVVCLSIGGLLYLGMKIFGFIEPVKYSKNANGIKLLSTGNNILLSYSF